MIREIERYGMHGPIRSRQQPLAHLLDEIDAALETERQQGAA